MILSSNSEITIKRLGYNCRCGVFVVSGEPWELDLHAQVSTLLYPSGVPLTTQSNGSKMGFTAH